MRALLIFLLAIIGFNYPLYYCQATEHVYSGIVEAVSIQTGLNPNIIKACIKSESNWDPTAESNKGAIGLMQVMPGTAAEVGIPETHLYDPYYNVLAGSRYLKKMYERFSDWGNAFAAYYIGPERIEKKDLSHKNWKGLSAYLKRVRKNYRNYSEKI